MQTKEKRLAELFNLHHNPVYVPCKDLYFCFLIGIITFPAAVFRQLSQMYCVWPLGGHRRTGFKFANMVYPTT